jgi:hypothetical protein
MKAEEILLLAAAAAAFYLAWRAYTGAEYLVTEKLNPASTNNVVYDNLIGGIGRTVSGSEHWSLGGWLYDITHPNAGGLN